MLEDVKAGVDRAAAFINCEIDGDFSSSAAGGSGGTQIWLAARQRIDDEQHVDTGSPFIHGTYVSNH